VEASKPPKVFEFLTWNFQLCVASLNLKRLEEVDPMTLQSLHFFSILSFLCFPVSLPRSWTSLHLLLVLFVSVRSPNGIGAEHVQLQMY